MLFAATGDDNMTNSNTKGIQRLLAPLAVAAYGSWALLPGEAWTLEGTGVLGTAVAVLFVGYIAGMVLSGLGTAVEAMTTPHPYEPGVDRCPDCEGDGRLPEIDCSTCDSTGVAL